MVALQLRPALLCLCLWTTALAVPAEAAMVRQLNLDEMCASADRVFRGTVLEARPGELPLAGGRVPTVTYRLRVSEALKGTFASDDEGPFADLAMVSPPAAEDARWRGPFDFLPRLEVGREYLLLTTRPGPSGLSTTVGLGQGCFTMAAGETALNEVGNAGLFDRMTTPQGWNGGPLAYEELRRIIREAVKR